MSNAAAQARRPICGFMPFPSLAEAPSRLHVPHQPAKRWPRRERSKHRLEPLDATPKHRLVAVDDGLVECLLDIGDGFDLRGIGTAQENAVSLRPVVLTRELRPFTRRHPREFERLQCKRHIM